MFLEHKTFSRSLFFENLFIKILKDIPTSFYLAWVFNYLFEFYKGGVYIEVFRIHQGISAISKHRSFVRRLLYGVDESEVVRMRGLGCTLFPLYCMFMIKDKAFFKRILKYLRIDNLFQQRLFLAFSMVALTWGGTYARVMKHVTPLATLSYHQIFGLF